MSSSERFCLHWNDFEVNISSAFRDLKNEKDFADVTLACGDNQVEAHKVILAASSPFFKRILKKNPHSHPLIYLKGIKSSDVEDVLKFIYQGEVSIDEGNLNTFLRVAEDLEVKGLVPEKDHDEGVSHMQSPFPKTNIQSANSTFTEQSSVQTNGQLPSQTQQKFSTSGNNNTSETVHVKVEAGESLIEDIIPPLVVLEEKQQENDANCPKHHQVQDTDHRWEYGEQVEEGLDGYSSKLTEGENIGKFQCMLCGKISNRRANSLIHVEAIHFPGRYEYECVQCDEKFDAKSKWAHHRSKVHSIKKAK